MSRVVDLTDAERCAVQNITREHGKKAGEALQFATDAIDGLSALDEAHLHVALLGAADERVAAIEATPAALDRLNKHASECLESAQRWTALASQWLRAAEGAGALGTEDAFALDKCAMYTAMVQNVIAEREATMDLANKVKDALDGTEVAP
jgi:hypothetical protein